METSLPTQVPSIHGISSSIPTPIKTLRRESFMHTTTPNASTPSILSSATSEYQKGLTNATITPSVGVVLYDLRALHPPRFIGIPRFASVNDVLFIVSSVFPGRHVEAIYFWVLMQNKTYKPVYLCFEMPNSWIALLSIVCEQLQYTSLVELCVVTKDSVPASSQSIPLPLSSSSFSSSSSSSALATFSSSSSPLSASFSYPLLSSMQQQSTDSVQSPHHHHHHHHNQQQQPIFTPRSAIPHHLSIRPVPLPPTPPSHQIYHPYVEKIMSHVACSHPPYHPNIDAKIREVSLNVNLQYLYLTDRQAFESELVHYTAYPHASTFLSVTSSLTSSSSIASQSVLSPFHIHTHPPPLLPSPLLSTSSLSQSNYVSSSSTSHSGSLKSLASTQRLGPNTRKLTTTSSSSSSSLSSLSASSSSSSSNDDKKILVQASRSPPPGFQKDIKQVSSCAKTKIHQTFASETSPSSFHLKPIAEDVIKPAFITLFGSSDSASSSSSDTKLQSSEELKNSKTKKSTICVTTSSKPVT